MVVEFEDQFGERQVIHRGSGSRLAIRRKSDTVSLAMTKAVGRLVGERIRRERVRRGISMISLAERAGLKGGKQAIYHIEQALSTGVRLGTLYAICAAMDLSLDAVLPSVSQVLTESGVGIQSDDKLATSA